MSLKGKVAVVTGSTSGIGLAMAQALAAEGANVLINGLETQERGDAIAKEIADAHGVQALFSAANMMKPEEITTMVDQAGKAWGSVDILVNNAGIQFTSPVQEFPQEKWDAIIAINLSALFHSTRAALPYMQKKSWGRIINTASVHGLVASVDKAAYVAAKHGVVGLTKVTALENAERGITCNAICPGWVDTPLIQQQIVDIANRKSISIDEATKELVGAKQPSKSFVQPASIGALTVFLCSDAAAGMTGVALPIDGGWTAQ